ncbi:phytase [Algivirga pacifica]|uniref:Phytase n=1 Tax=Algivirga pacifica TaxID=1162670 RepID=A0ABP9D9X8_9BACT
MKNYTIVFLLCTLIGCTSKKTEKAYKDPRESDASMQIAYGLQDSIMIALQPTMETQAVVAPAEEDAADDPTLWIHATDRSKSLIFGTHKKKGLYAYTLEGAEVAFYPVGSVNNVDIRQQVILGMDTVDLLAASNRSEHGITLMQIDSIGRLAPLGQGVFPVSEAIDEVYGFCMGYDQESHLTYLYVNGKNGVIEQYQLIKDSVVQLQLRRTLKVASQPEGMVVDDISGMLYIGEEAVGIWKTSAFDHAIDSLSFIEATSVANNKAIEADVEGIALYRQDSTQQYLVVSSQGNFSYALIDMTMESYMGSFKIVDSNTIDGVEETDGLEVYAGELPGYPKGVLIVQDGFNFDGEVYKPQNFKVVSWEQVEDAFLTTAAR